jgi:FMN phosphatase YigB (HAD superfamily)
MSNEPGLIAVCFDFKGVVMDHRQTGKALAGMLTLLQDLALRHIRLSLISRNPVAVVRKSLGKMAPLFGDHVYSGGGSGKLACIRQFAEQIGIDDLSRIAFVDDKPNNILPVARESNVYVIGFRGSGKYPLTRQACLDEGIPFAETVDELTELLMK